MNHLKNNIHDIVKSRKIEWLCHFTPIENLDSIKKNGLKLRDELVMKVTDVNRADCSNNICLSISEPNKWMFNFKIKQGYDLALLIIKSSVLYEKECLFFPYNAATRNYRSIPYEYLSTPEALSSMFGEIVTYKKLGDNLKEINRDPFFDSFITTTGQAEVQVVENIEPEYIEYIFTDNIPLNYFDIHRQIVNNRIKKMSEVIELNIKNHSESKDNINPPPKIPGKIYITNDMINDISKRIKLESNNKKEKESVKITEKSDYDGCFVIVVILIIMYFIVF